MTRLVIARLARGGKLVCAGRSSLAGLDQVVATCRSCLSMTGRLTAPFSSPTNSTSFPAGAAIPATQAGVSSSFTSATSDPHATPAPLQKSHVQFAPPAVQPRLALRRLIIRLRRSQTVGGTLGPAVLRAESGCLNSREGGGGYKEQ